MIPHKELFAQKRFTAIANRLRESGYRLTPQRAAIIQALLERTDHPSAEDLYRQVSAHFPMISLATVYKTLETLKDLGEAAEITLADRVRYDGNTRPHVHLVCEKCHAVADWNCEIPFPIPEEAIAASGFRPSHYRLEVYGLCSRCQAENTEYTASHGWRAGAIPIERR